MGRPRHLGASSKRASAPYTAFYWLSAVDLQQDAAGAIVRSPADQAIFIDVFGRTFWIAGARHAVHADARLPGRLPAGDPAGRDRANLLMILVLLPFWTSLLVRTTAWFVLLQTEGPDQRRCARLASSASASSSSSTASAPSSR